MYVTLSLYQAAIDLGPSPDVLPYVVPMMAGVERAFDSYRMCAVPSRDAVTEDVSFEVSGSSHHCDCVGVCLCVSQRQGCVGNQHHLLPAYWDDARHGRGFGSVHLTHDSDLCVACVVWHVEHCMMATVTHLRCCVQLWLRLSWCANLARCFNGFCTPADPHSGPSLDDPACVPGVCWQIQAGP